MHDSLLMHVFEGTRDLMDVLDDALLLEVYFVLHGLLYHKLEITFLSPFYCNEKLIELAVDEPAEILNDVWVI